MCPDPPFFWPGKGGKVKNGAINMTHDHGYQNSTTYASTPVPPLLLRGHSLAAVRNRRTVKN